MKERLYEARIAMFQGELATTPFVRDGHWFVQTHPKGWNADWACRQGVRVPEGVADELYPELKTLPYETYEDSVRRMAARFHPDTGWGIPECTAERDIYIILVESGLAQSFSEARRLVSQRAVYIDGKHFDSLPERCEFVVRRGKNHSRRITC